MYGAYYQHMNPYQSRTTRHLPTLQQYRSFNQNNLPLNLSMQNRQSSQRQQYGIQNADDANYLQSDRLGLQRRRSQIDFVWQKIDSINKELSEQPSKEMLRSASNRNFSFIPSTLNTNFPSLAQLKSSPSATNWRQETQFSSMTLQKQNEYQPLQQQNEYQPLQQQSEYRPLTQKISTEKTTNESREHIDQSSILNVIQEEEKKTRLLQDQLTILKEKYDEQKIIIESINIKMKDAYEAKISELETILQQIESSFAQFQDQMSQKQLDSNGNNEEYLKATLKEMKEKQLLMSDVMTSIREKDAELEKLAELASKFKQLFDQLNKEKNMLLQQNELLMHESMTIQELFKELAPLDAEEEQEVDASYDDKEQVIELDKQQLGEASDDDENT